MRISPKAAAVRLLHLHSSFEAGETVRRCTALINALGAKAQHVIVSADPDALGALDAIAPRIRAECDYDFPSLEGRASLGRLKALAEAMRGYDLVLTYGWAAIAGAMAHTLFARHFGLPPHIHHEDALDEQEAVKLRPGRNWYRRIALGGSAGLVVPSARLERIALSAWAQPRGRVLRIPSGVNTAELSKRPRADALPGLIKRKGENWIGTVALAGTGKDCGMLLRAVADLPEDSQLVVVEALPAERPAWEREAQKLGIEHRVHFAGKQVDRAKAVALCDLFALAPGGEPVPAAALQAMAAGLPLAALSSEELTEVVAGENAPFLALSRDQAALSRALWKLDGDASARKEAGEANRRKALAQYQEEAMIQRLAALYGSATGVRDLV